MTDDEKTAWAWAEGPATTPVAVDLGEGTCASDKVSGSKVVGDTFKVDHKFTYWFSGSSSFKLKSDAAEATVQRFGAADSQTYTVTTASGAFAMTLAAGLVATAAVAF